MSNIALISDLTNITKDMSIAEAEYQELILSNEREIMQLSVEYKSSQVSDLNNLERYAHKYKNLEQLCIEEGIERCSPERRIAMWAQLETAKAKIIALLNRTDKCDNIEMLYQKLLVIVVVKELTDTALDILNPTIHSENNNNLTKAEDNIAEFDEIINELAEAKDNIAKLERDVAIRELEADKKINATKLEN